MGDGAAKLKSVQPAEPIYFFPTYLRSIPAGRGPAESNNYNINLSEMLHRTPVQCNRVHS